MLFDEEELQQQLKGLACHSPSFDGLAEAIAAGEKPKSDRWEGNRSSRKSKEDDGGGWSGAESYEAACDVATYGWAEGRDMTAAQLDAIWESGCAAISSSPSEELDVSGYAPDVEAYVQGDPFCMLNDGDETGEKPVIRLIVNVVCSCGVNAKLMANRAAALAALVDVIESSGNSCEVWSMWAAAGYSSRRWLEGRERSKIEKPERNRAFVPTIKLKSAGVPVAIDDIAFGLGHPAMLRRLMFAIAEADPFFARDKDKYDDSFEGDYGYPTDLPERVMPKDAIYFNRIDRDGDPRKMYATPEKAAETILATYNRQAAEKNLKEIDNE